MSAHDRPPVAQRAPEFHSKCCEINSGVRCHQWLEGDVFLADPQPQRLDISEMAASNADPSVGMIIGAAAGVSSLLIVATIFIGYWILKRRERVRPAGQ